MRAAIVLAGGMAIAVAGCTNPNGTTNNTGTDSILGTGAGALLGGTLGAVLGQSPAAALAGIALGGLAGYLGGSYAGHQLDARDRALAAQQTTAVLAEPAPTPPPGQAVVISAPQRHPHRWVSDHTTRSGSSTLEQVSTTPEGNECRLVRELAVINGREVVQHTSFCQTASGSWRAEAA